MSATRRDALKVLAATTSLPLVTQAATDAKNFTAEEFAVLSRLSDLILPRTDTPGAVDAGVPAILDDAAGRSPGLRKTLREGIASLGGAKFLSQSEAGQNETLRRISGLDGAAPMPFFTVLKNQVIDAYYSTKEGLVTELGYHGNVPLAEFPGCTHPEHQRLD
jgi:hypothetical protein